VQGSLEGALSGIVGLQAHLPESASILLGVAALAAATLPGISRLTQYVNTMAHEGAHAVMGSATGRRVTGVTLHGNGDGRTTLSQPHGAGYLLAGIAGYLGPSAFGVGAAKLIEVGHIVAVLWLALVALAILAFPARRSGFGLAVVIVSGVLVFLVARYSPLGVQVAVSYGIAWFLLVSGVRVVLQHGSHAGDAIILREVTRLPRGLWSGLWLAGTVAALLYGGALLV
jgi:hypothetical protein